MTEFRSQVRGVLPPADGPTGKTAVAGIALPPGLLVAPDPEFAAADAPDANAAPLAWVTREPQRDAAKLWSALAGTFADCGLWPIVCETLDTTGRPWTTGELMPAQPVSATPVVEVLAAMWERAVPDPEEDDPFVLADLEPFTRTFPGLAAAIAGPRDDGAVPAAAAECQGHLGLVAVERPADVPAALGWTGAVNVHDDPGDLSTVLRSWEDRFGAVLVGIGFDTMTLAVQRPPRTPELAAAVAAELFAFCPDLVHQGAGSIADLAAELVGARRWSFWWD